MKEWNEATLAIAREIKEATYDDLMDFAQVISDWTATDDEGNDVERRISREMTAALLSDWAGNVIDAAETPAER